MSYPTPRTNPPTVAALSAAVMLFLVIAGAVVVLALGKRLDSTSTPMIITLMGVVVSAVPALIGAAFAERASKDIRNGTLVEKSREGAARAIEDKVPTFTAAASTALDEAQVVTRTGPVVTAELVALTRILDRLTTHAEGQPPASAEPERP